MDNKRIQDLYKKEAESLIKKIEKGLSSFNGQRTTNNKQRLFHLFRYAHTLKGISGACGNYEIEAAAKSITEIFRAAKNGELEINAKNKVMIKKKLKECEKLLRRVIKGSKYTGKVNRKLLIDTGRRLQETSQKLFMAKQELEKKNKELEKSRRMEHEQNEHLRHELNALKHLAGDKVEDKGLGNIKGVTKNKLTRSIAEDISLRYIHLLESYIKSKDLDKDESLVDELCRKLIEYGVTPKGIISMHLKSMPQIKTIGGLETKRVMFESRMVLLKVMTSYASLLRSH